MATTQPLQFDDTTNGQGIIQLADFLCSTNSTTYPKADKVRSANLGLDRVASLIQLSNGDWSWEDSAQTDLPIATTDIVANQYDYSIDTTFLNVKGVYAKDAGGYYQEIFPVNEQRILTMASGLDIGYPEGYYLSGKSIYLYPIPQSAQTSGLKVHFERNVIYYDTTSTTTVAGFNPQFHRLISLYIARDWAIAKEKDRLLNTMLIEIEKVEKDLMKFYARRDKAENTQIKVAGLDIDNFK